MEWSVASLCLSINFSLIFYENLSNLNFIPLCTQMERSQLILEDSEKKRLNFVPKMQMREVKIEEADSRRKIENDQFFLYLSFLISKDL